MLQVRLRNFHNPVPWFKVRSIKQLLSCTVLGYNIVNLLVTVVFGRKQEYIPDSSCMVGELLAYVQDHSRLKRLKESF